jgi:hypothetical protein
MVIGWFMFSPLAFRAQSIHFKRSIFDLLGTSSKRVIPEPNNGRFIGLFAYERETSVFGTMKTERSGT